MTSPAKKIGRARHRLPQPQKTVRGAGVIPLAGAVLMIAVGPQAFSSAEYGVFRLLVTALIIVGMAGFQMAATVANLISRTISALTEGKLA